MKERRNLKKKWFDWGICISMQWNVTKFVYVCIFNIDFCISCYL